MKLLLLLISLGIGTTIAVMYSGIVNVAADEPHSDFVYWLLEETRENSIKKAAKNIEVPNLKNPEQLLTGGTDYEFMCASCHLAPGQTESDMSLGLYPAPPNLTIAAQSHEGHEHGDETQSDRKNFWVIKHGIKASGMPAWGKTHDDERIWAMVAFIKRLPTLTPEQYQVLTAVE
ncbi:c-type cytochrome [Colwellia hornerae]|uniref:Cytochrome c n=1 Tax=Colwellia hornerae TaxID=89402 RepID=A0A5C6QNA0_9GAMM|nr:cytochrome c [Colwellia hornerae]TWX54636.1 cytochrome c [Colwellia hornerae]TWX61076.1 cytochrome c [Colwellia hornerae]TWX70329.1 cytochrome c [Colwellia hornerae]